LRNSKPVAANDPLNPFDLAYNMLDIAVSLKNNSTPQFSYIDPIATKSCFDAGVGAKWNYNGMDGNKAILTATSSSVSISFANFPVPPDNSSCGTTFLPGNTGNKITFTYNPPPGLVDPCGGPPNTRCAYAELFTVVVNAYPGEQNGIQFDLRRYLPAIGGSECTIQQVITGANNGSTNVPVINPLHYTSTANADILAQFGATISVPNGRAVPITITNTGAQPITVNYLEFMVRATTLNIDQPFEYSISPPPRESTSGGGQNLHYVIPNLGVTLDPNSSYTVGNIIFKTPVLSNLPWAANFSFLDSGPVAPSRSRIKTSLACTSLRASINPSNNSNIGDTPCTDSSVRFKVEGEGLTCSTSKVKVGFRTTSSSAQIRLKKVEFELDFSWTDPGISITGVNYPSNWPSINCGTIGCFTVQGQKVCWELGPGGSKFKFCFETDDANPPVFLLSDFANMEILFNTPNNACIQNVKISKLRIIYALSSDPCIPVIDAIAGFPLCGSTSSMLSGKVATELSKAVSDVTLTLTGADASPNMNGMQDCPSVSCSSSCTKTKLSDMDGAYLFSCADCPVCNRLKVIPGKNDNHINGVTTFDLVLISKHILGIEPFDSPYKMIAADANKSGSITTFDIVELRKLILGIYTVLPQNTSWRFVDKAFTFPNLANPFQSAFPEGINCIEFPASGKDFVGVKVGDVNNTVMLRPSVRPLIRLSWPALRPKAGEYITVPVAYTGLDPLEAIQLGLRFDPSSLQLIGPSQGDIESYLPGNFNLLNANEGEIRTLWLPMTDASERILPNKVLFYLTFKVLEALPESGLPIWLDDQLLDCAAWKPDGSEFAVGYEAAAARRDEAAVATKSFQAHIYPNPAAGDATITVESLQAEPCRIALFDAFGQRLFLHEVSLIEGSQDIRLPEVGALPAGVYFWKAYTRSFEAAGHLIKQ
jgi:hypothetical protein